jgi:O-antigen biosynthesis alpha-1,2-mannosyltransferase
MRIVIDLQGAQTESRFRGIGRYSKALAQAIARNAGEHEIWIVLNSSFQDSIIDVRAAFDGLVPAERMLIFDVPPLLSWENPSNAWRRRAAELIRESFLSELQPDIVHVSSLFEGANLCDAALSIGTLEPSIKVAVTLYDLIPLLDPKNYLGCAWISQWYMDKVDNLKRADLLLSISAYSRLEAMDALGIDGDRIASISSAHTDIFRPCDEETACKQARFSRYGITQPFVMYNGALESRKNLDRLLQAFALLAPALRNTHQLVFVGKVFDFDRERLVRLATSLDIDKQLVLTGYVSDHDLAALFTHCALFVFPSLHEGFGLPALEAMACGAATIGSNVTSIPEVIGRPDALFDPTDPGDIANKISQVLSDERFLCSLREHALVQASKFSWDNCARASIAAFEELAKGKPVTEPASWPEIAARRERGYQHLIESIALIPRHPVGPSDTDLIEVARCIATNRSITEHIARACELPESITWRIEGPFDSSYSLALLNRETARALDVLGHHVVLHSTEGPGDFQANPDFLRDQPNIANFHDRSRTISAAASDVTSRNLYPPRVADMDCRMNLLHHYAWEESGFPSEWVESFNESLQGVTCLSLHVEKILVDHGMTVPMLVSGCGVDHWERIHPDGSYRIKGKSFRFLHVSSCFPRKGADVLLKAYGQSFTSRDDVTLVIKTFPNPHNEIHRWLAEARAESVDFPEVLIIEDDLTDAQLKSVYQQCHVMVAPSRAEGFGLPMAEAMLSGLAVITTGWSGQLDFCNEKTAWLVDYQFTNANTHFGLFDSVWAEPDVGHLAATMRQVYECPPALRNERTTAGKQLLLEKFKWADVAKRLVNAARSWSQQPMPREPRVGWVSSWNTRCGIATYSTHLVENIPSKITIFAAKTTDIAQQDEPEVVRCWSTGEEDTLNELAGNIDSHQIDVLVIQFNYSFYNLQQFGHFLSRQLEIGRVVVVTMHSTSDPVHVLPHKRLEAICEPLARCHRILVHAPGDLNRLKALGLINNVALFPHGVREYTPPQRNRKQSLRVSVKECFTIASYGFFLPHKGLIELIEAVALLMQRGSEVRLKMVNAEYPVPESASLIRQAKAKISALQLDDHVVMTTAFLPDDESLTLLSEADLIVFPYQMTGESASGAVRYGLSVGKPVAVTPLAIFDDVAPAVFKLPGTSSKEIANGIQQIISAISEDSQNCRAKAQEAARWRTSHSYTILGQRLYGVIKQLQ